MAKPDRQRPNTWSPTSLAVAAGRPLLWRHSGREVSGDFSGYELESSELSPRSTAESRQNSSRYGRSAATSGTLGCTSQSMAPTSVRTSVMSFGFDIGGLGYVLPAHDLLD